MENSTKVQIEIMFYFMRNGELNALLGRYGYMTESALLVEPRKGHYRPTICIEAENNDFITLVSVAAKYLGGDVVDDLVTIFNKAKMLDCVDKSRYVAVVPVDMIEKIKQPFYFGCLRPITRTEVADIVEVPADGSWVFNRIPMTAGEGWRDFILEGFECLSK